MHRDIPAVKARHDQSLLPPSTIQGRPTGTPTSVDFRKTHTFFRDLYSNLNKLTILKKLTLCYNQTHILLESDWLLNPKKD